MTDRHFPQPVSERRRVWPWVTLAAVGGLVLGGAIGSVGGGATATAAGASAPATVTVTAPPSTITMTASPKTTTVTAPAPPPETVTVEAEPEQPSSDGVGPGTHIVGTDIEPGTYRTEGPTDSAIPNCYWERLSGTSGEFDDVITNGLPQGPGVVTIAESDVAFSTSGCQPWTPTG